MSVCVYVCVRERYCLLSEVRDDSSLFTDMAVFLISDEDDTTVHEYTPNQDKPTPHKIRHYTNSVSWNRNSFFGLKKKKTPDRQSDHHIEIEVRQKRRYLRVHQPLQLSAVFGLQFLFCL